MSHSILPVSGHQRVDRQVGRRQTVLLLHTSQGKRAVVGDGGSGGEETLNCSQRHHSHQFKEPLKFNQSINQLLVEPGTNIEEIRRSQWNNKTYKAHKEHLQ